MGRKAVDQHEEYNLELLRRGEWTMGHKFS